MGEAQEPVRGDSLGLSLQLERLDRLDLDRLAGETVGQGADQDLHSACRLLESCGNIDRIPDDEMLSLGRIPGHDLARVHAGAAGQPDAPAGLELVVQALERRPHSLRRGHRTQRVVLANDREPEDGHHRIPDVLLDDAAMILQHASHLDEVACHHDAQRLRVECLAEARRSGEVAEDDGDELPRRLRGGVRDEFRPAESAQTEFVGILLPTVGAHPHVSECTSQSRAQMSRTGVIGLAVAF